MRVGSLFSGIGGLDLGLERAGMEIVWQVEVDEWCRRVLARHFPNAVRYGDVRAVKGAYALADANSTGLAIGQEQEDFGGDLRDEGSAIATSRLGEVDLICGGFPCQPVSHAGQRKGDADERWLWPEFRRVIREVRPEWVLVENVPGLLSIDAGRLFGLVLSDLAALGFDAEWDSIGAADVGAPHLRKRVFIVAHAAGNGRIGGQRGKENLLPQIGQPERADQQRKQREHRAGENGEPSNPQRNRLEESRFFGVSPGETDAVADGSWWAVEPDVGRVAHGVPSRVDRLKGLGNAVVPQVAEHIGRLILNA